MEKHEYTLRPVGQVTTGNGCFCLKIDKPFRPALQKLDCFGHLIAVWWAHEHDTPESRKILKTGIPYANDMEAGVFACRSEYRPNPVGITTCQILSVDIAKGIVTVPYIDANDGTPLLDIKGYFPVSDRIRDIKVPEWVKEWPEWYEDAYKLEELFARMYS